jgi:uncharacterized protein (TIGR03067 family)
VYPSLLTALALAVGAPAAKEDPKKNSSSLVGVWVAEKGAVGGDDRAIQAGSVTIEFTADGKVGIREGGRQPDPVDYHADPKKNPAEIDINGPPEMKDLNMRGIYRVEGDTLTLCLSRGEKRPTEFASAKGSDVLLLALRRATPKD